MRGGVIVGGKARFVSLEDGPALPEERRVFVFLAGRNVKVIQEVEISERDQFDLMLS